MLNFDKKQFDYGNDEKIFQFSTIVIKKKSVVGENALF